MYSFSGGKITTDFPYFSYSGPIITIYKSVRCHFIYQEYCYIIFL